MTPTEIIAEAHRIAGLGYRYSADSDFYVMRNSVLDNTVVVTNRDDVQPLGRLLEAAPAMSRLIAEMEPYVRGAQEAEKNYRKGICDAAFACEIAMQEMNAEARAICTTLMKQILILPLPPDKEQGT